MGDCILADESGRASGELRSVLRGAYARRCDSRGLPTGGAHRAIQLRLPNAVPVLRIRSCARGRLLG